MYDRKLRCAEVIDCQDALVSRKNEENNTNERAIASGAIKVRK